jgi:tRNA threonylcarbamoyladenosine modification (KEOPS) complex  Pcc1 subunit
MTNQVRFRIDFPSGKDARIIAQSLSPEIQHKIPKSNVTFSVHEKTLEVTIKSDDISSLRAACNSYLRWIQTAFAVKELI